MVVTARSRHHLQEFDGCSEKSSEPFRSILNTKAFTEVFLLRGDSRRTVVRVAHPRGNASSLFPIPEEVRQLARIHTENSINTLAEIMMDDTKAETVRAHCADILLNRGWGKPKEHIEVGPNMDLVTLLTGMKRVSNDTSPLELAHEVVNDDGE